MAPEVGPRNGTFVALPPAAFTASDPGAEIHPDAAPLPGDSVVTKNRVSAFPGSVLRQAPAAQGIGHLVLAGTATGGVVLATACRVADLDFRLTFLADGCSGPDPELHRMLVERVLARRATPPPSTAGAGPSPSRPAEVA
ncbi:isochorismatase family cysteine hydrolase [Streptomyces sp. NPDC001508]|uniref:isochorismatase family cysteine hydrolase n=1 Tax=Streptomyces sp. NPDC001508 TaxID=3154656 RepID=UPI00331DA668